MFRRGWKLAGPPNPELPPDMDDSKGQTATLELVAAKRSHV